MSAAPQSPRRPKPARGSGMDQEAREVVLWPDAGELQVFRRTSSANLGLISAVPNRLSQTMLAVTRKRRFLDVRREGRGGLAEFETEESRAAFSQGGREVRR